MGLWLNLSSDIYSYKMDRSVIRFCNFLFWGESDNVFCIKKGSCIVLGRNSIFCRINVKICVEDYVWMLSS